MCIQDSGDVIGFHQYKCRIEPDGRVAYNGEIPPGMGEHLKRIQMGPPHLMSFSTFSMMVFLFFVIIIIIIFLVEETSMDSPHGNIFLAFFQFCTTGGLCFSRIQRRG